MALSGDTSELIYGDQARQALSAGISRAVAAVAATYGPRGRLVVVENPVGDPFGVTPPTLTRDGNVVLDEAEFGSPAERLGVHLLQQAVSEISLRHGDATTTATILCGSLVVSFSRLVAAGLPVSDLVHGLDAGVTRAREQLRRWAARPSEQGLQAMARRAMGSCEASDAVLKAIEIAGTSGAVTVDVVEGAAEPFQLQRQQEGVVWPYARTHDELAASGASMLALFRDPVHSFAALMPLLEAAHRAGRGLTIVTPDCSADVITLLSLNKRLVPTTVHGTPNDPDWRGCLLEDLSTATGAQLFSPELGVSPIPSGLAKISVASEHDQARFTPADPPDHQARARSGALEAALASAEQGLTRDQLVQRLRLFSPDAHITVSAPTRVLAKHRANLVQNAVASLRHARTGLVIPGGGAGLHYAASQTTHGAVGAVNQALRQPLHALLRSVDLEPGVIQDTLRPPQVFDVRTRQVMDPWQAGLLDPLPPIDEALAKGAELVRLLLRTELVVVEPERTHTGPEGA